MFQKKFETMSLEQRVERELRDREARDLREQSEAKGKETDRVRSAYEQEMFQLKQGVLRRYLFTNVLCTY